MHLLFIHLLCILLLRVGWKSHNFLSFNVQVERSQGLLPHLVFYMPTVGLFSDICKLTAKRFKPSKHLKVSNFGAKCSLPSKSFFVHQSAVQRSLVSIYASLLNNIFRCLCCLRFVIDVFWRKSCDVDNNFRSSFSTELFSVPNHAGGAPAELVGETTVFVLLGGLGAWGLGAEAQRSFEIARLQKMHQHSLLFLKFASNIQQSLLYL